MAVVLLEYILSLCVAVVLWYLYSTCIGIKGEKKFHPRLESDVTRNITYKNVLATHAGIKKSDTGSLIVIPESSSYPTKSGQKLVNFD